MMKDVKQKGGETSQSQDGFVYLMAEERLEVIRYSLH